MVGSEADNDEYSMSSCACAISLRAACIFSNVFWPFSTICWYNKNLIKINWAFYTSNVFRIRKHSLLQVFWQPLDFPVPNDANFVLATLVNYPHSGAIRLMYQCLLRTCIWLLKWHIFISLSRNIRMEKIISLLNTLKSA